MRYLTKDWFILSQSFPVTEDRRRELDRLTAAYRKAQADEALPAELRQSFSFHDGTVEAARHDGDIVLRVSSPYSRYRSVRFCGALLKQELPPPGAVWLYEELYRHKSGRGYEAHILLYSGLDTPHRVILPEELTDLKIVCSDIQFEL